jgi:hypothetical protein
MAKWTAIQLPMEAPTNALRSIVNPSSVSASQVATWDGFDSVRVATLRSRSPTASIRYTWWDATSAGSNGIHIVELNDLACSATRGGLAASPR